jgi:hypothetical protein
MHFGAQAAVGTGEKGRQCGVILFRPHKGPGRFKSACATHNLETSVLHVAAAFACMQVWRAGLTGLCMLVPVHFLS